MDRWRGVLSSHATCRAIGPAGWQSRRSSGDAIATQGGTAIDVDHERAPSTRRQLSLASLWHGLLQSDGAAAAAIGMLLVAGGALGALAVRSYDHSPRGPIRVAAATTSTATTSTSIVRMTTTSTSTTLPPPTVPPSTTVVPESDLVVRKPDPWPEGCCAPLTGMGYDDPALANMTTHAVKVDNSTPAPPHTNLQLADLIYELRVEDVSRFIAIYHSRLPDVVGPIRSARTSDPPILSPLGNPIVSFSGGNPNVRTLFSQLPWLLDANAMVAGGAYFRNFDGDRVVPHNLYVRAASLRNANYQFGTAPPPQFEILAEGEGNPVGQPASRVVEQVGNVPSEFTWDPETRYWLRDEYGEPHTDVTGEQIGRRNVVTLAVEYIASGADSRSPEAVTVGSGEAWVLVEDQLIVGRWSRPTPESTWTLTSNDGLPIKLAPGPTWVNLVDIAPSFELG